VFAFRSALTVLFFATAMQLAATPAVSIAPEAESPQVRYALRRLTALPAAQTIPLRVELATGSGIGPDGFALRREGATLVVAGSDARGAMYGILDVAQQLTQGVAFAEIKPRIERAALPFRAIKFNLPFAAYRTSPSIELHQETCRDPAYWEAFLDMMATNRFNTLTLWSLHPFHYFVVPKSFPEAQTFSDGELAEWRTLWTKLFALAKERGIETYLINWNIFVSPEFARAHQLATYSIDWRHFGDGPTDQIVADYTRECVQQVIDEYPDLTGLGITLGERMGGMDPQARRDWLDASFFVGIAAAKRPVKFIYRAPLSADTKSGGTTSEENDRATRAQIERVAAMTNIVKPVHVEFKFNWSHGHSSPQLFIVHGGKLGDAYWNPAPRGYDVVWTVRNEDIHVLRWGDPQFVRDFVQSNQAPHMGGALVGSEVFIPAKDYMSNEGRHRTWRYAFERNWLGWSVWGRLLHAPATSDDYFAAELGARFGATHGDDLQRAWALASRTPLRFASFHQGRNDLSLYTEAFSGWRERGGEWRFFDIENFIAHPVLDSRYVNIADFTAAGQKVPAGKISPLALADLLERDLTEVARLVTAIRTHGSISPTFDAELTDLECWVEWGGYFAAKLRGGVALAQFRATHQGSPPGPCADAILHLERARDHWKKLATLGTRFNWRQIVFHTAAPFSWEYFLPMTERDIAIARGEVAPASPRPMGKDG
jgi:hypothetical protein